ncbi:hypothetical protein BS78_K033100 [Paspalum vaginatum]|uniref:DUF295 domain-containing protein n=1 Tax=Paspalum vaginatum TaxID=158149 RepID=A0A9W8CCV6_9POAL|nr:hypothetical protein BS78_K033100 [Paspalum vaginatum]
MPCLPSLTVAVVCSHGSAAADPLFTLVVTCDLPCHALYWADPESKAFSYNTCPLAALRPWQQDCTPAAASTDRRPLIRWSTSIDCGRRLMIWNTEHRSFAVGGGETEILLVDLTESRHCIKVHKKAGEPTAAVLEQVMSIGRRALFVSDRCLLVDADKFPTIEANCAYCQLAGSSR